MNFEVITQCAWETISITFQFSLLNGGPASMVYGGILAGFGATAVAMSLAEMASMCVCPMFDSCQQLIALGILPLVRSIDGRPTLRLMHLGFGD